MNTNRISAELSPEDQAAALANLLANDTLLAFVVGLTPAQKKVLNKAANFRIPFINKALMHAQQHPEVLPGTFNLTEFAKDVSLDNSFGAVVAAHGKIPRHPHPNLERSLRSGGPGPQSL